MERRNLNETNEIGESGGGGGKKEKKIRRG